MRCRAGDLAVVLRGPHRDCVCEVVSASGVPDFHWSVRFRSPKWWRLSEDETPVLHTEGLYSDFDLRPIRDPGDDAVDETLLWKRVPIMEAA